jgi:hypothetical protein
LHPLGSYNDVAVGDRSTAVSTQYSHASSRRTAEDNAGESGSDDSDDDGDGAEDSEHAEHSEDGEDGGTPRTL